MSYNHTGSPETMAYIKGLEIRIEELEDDNNEALVRISELERDNAELRKDAVRCDYLLRASFDDSLLKHLEDINAEPKNPEEWRATIDAAIKKESGNA